MRLVRWRSVGDVGAEHLLLDQSAGAVHVESAVIGSRGGVPYAIRYGVRCRADWTFELVDIDVLGGRSLSLRSDGQGEWWQGGERVDALKGCIDIDISATPFTNTLPIRRLLLERKERREIRVAYISVPSLEVTPVDQAYSCIEPGTRYRYEGLFRGFVADLEVDQDGLVEAYPTLFERC